MRLFSMALAATAALWAAMSTPIAQGDALAQANTATRYWPVVTASAEWNTISAGEECVRLRCFSAPRPVSRLDNPQRRHVGIDLFASAGDTVIAIEDGRVVGFYPFLRAATGEMSYALLIAHNGYVANYGEVRANSLTAHGLAIGSTVRAGQAIATVSDTAQLHFETYQPNTTRNASWRYAEAQPASVRDPTDFLRGLVAQGERRTPTQMHAAAH